MPVILINIPKILTLLSFVFIENEKFNLSFIHTIGNLHWHIINKVNP